MAFVFLMLVFFIDCGGYLISDKHCLLSFFFFIVTVVKIKFCGNLIELGKQYCKFAIIHEYFYYVLPTEGERNILFLVLIPLALAGTSA